ncbi:MAG: transposase [Opitutaceae bacterium]|jgi:transposase
MNTNDYAAFVGLDWGDKTHAFALQLKGIEKIETGTLAASAETFHQWLEGLGARCAGRRVALAIEAGHRALLHAMAEHPWLDIFPIHPATCDRFRAAFRPSGAKDDIPDALTLLTLVTQHREKLQRWRMDGAPTRELSGLVLARRHAVDRRTQLSSQLRTVLKGYFPQALELIGDELERPLALDFLQRWPDLASVQKVRPATLRSFYNLHTVRRPQLIEKRIELIRLARPLVQDTAIIAPAVMQVQMFVDMLRAQQKHIERFETRIDEAFAAHPAANFFRQLPGAGPAFGPRLLVAFGDDPARYPAASNLQMYAGIAPVQKKSGQQLWIHWRWLAPVFLRQTFTEWAGQTVLHSPWARAYYFRQKRLGKTRNVILRALAFKWIRILWRCWQNHEPYDEARYQESLKRRRSPLTAELETGLTAA